MENLKRICTLTALPFAVTPTEQELLRKFEAPPPTLHPSERMRRLTAFSNYLNLFQRTCSKTGDRIISNFRPGTPFPVYRSDLWWSDEWDALSYGRDYDFRRPFFDQFKDLLDAVPKPALSVTYNSLENCDYINGASFCKNCYLIFNASYNEDCYYCYFIQQSKDCIDCSSVFHSELCYDCTYVERSYDVQHGFNCRDCRQCAFVWNCVGCHDCFGCVNLRQASYCWYNEQLSGAEFERRKGAFHGDSYSEVERERLRFMEFVRSKPQPAIRGVEAQACTGDFLDHCTNAQHCFECVELQDCVNCFRVSNSHDCLDQYSWGVNCELIYDTCRSGYQSQNIRHSAITYLNSSEVEYTYFAATCKNCFGCVGIHHQEYCIFNKKYSKSEYAEMRSRIIAQMKDPQAQGGRAVYGEFFPYSLSPHPYNDSDAELLFPLERAEVLRRGALVLDEIRPSELDALPVSSLQDRSSDTSDAVCKKALSCPKSGKTFRITAQELKRYHERGLPLPRRHWLMRVFEREAGHSRAVLHEGVSTKSGKPVITTFPPGSQWQVWATDEYNELFR